MKSLKLRQLNIFCIVILLVLASGTFAQELSVGADFVSRYVWRGADIGDNNPSIQPYVEFGYVGFTAGFWGAYSFSNSNTFEEVDMYLKYTQSSDFGDFSLGFTDYTNPNNGVKMGNFYNFDDPKGPGAHSVELCANYEGPDYLPLSFSYNMFLYNVENNPIYLELGYTANINDVELNAFVGGTPGDKTEYEEGKIGYYKVEKFSIINIGFKATKTIKVTDSFSIPLFGSVSLNPADEKMFYVLGVSL